MKKFFGIVAIVIAMFVVSQFANELYTLIDLPLLSDAVLNHSAEANQARDAVSLMFQIGFAAMAIGGVAGIVKIIRA